MQIEVGDFVIASSCKNGDVQSNWGIGTVTNIYHNQYGTFYGLCNNYKYARKISLEVADNLIPILRKLVESESSGSIWHYLKIVERSLKIEK